MSSASKMVKMWGPEEALKMAKMEVESAKISLKTANSPAVKSSMKKRVMLAELALEEVEEVISEG